MNCPSLILNCIQAQVKWADVITGINSDQVVVYIYDIYIYIYNVQIYILPSYPSIVLLAHLWILVFLGTLLETFEP